MKKSFKLIFLAILIFLFFQGSHYIMKNVIFPNEYNNYVMKYSDEYDLDPMLVFAVMKAESNFNPDAASNKDAKGLMQITGSTGTWIAEKLNMKDFNVEMLNNPEVNIRFGCWYLRYLIDESVSEDIAIAAYNAGIGNVKNWLKNPKYSTTGDKLDYIPFKETDKYVKKVKVYKNIYQKLYN
ncbi:MAG: lytic transglycosylase domain-containing protein [Sarcina sp.]